MNLASLVQLLPVLADKPSVVYFHENQLPDVKTNTDAPLDLVNLSTANAATEIWFNSDWHRKTFLLRAKALIDRHPEMSGPGHDVVFQLKKKASVMSPPVDFSAVSAALNGGGVERDGTALFVETRDGEIGLLNKALAILRDRKETFRIIAVGPATGLANNRDGIALEQIPESDVAAHVRALCEAGVFVSVKPDATSDLFVVRGLAAGCRPVLPATGFYRELLPPTLQKSCLYEPHPVDLANRLQDALSPFQPAVRRDELRRTLAPFDPAAACRQFDERFEELVWVRAVD
jgi:hypothetical protein